MARPRLITDEQILTTMRSCVLERGAGVSLDVVAEQLGVTSPALLKRFGSRVELMLKALQPPDAPPWMATFDLGPDSRPLEAQLTEHFQRLWDFFTEVIPCVSALRESGVPHEKIFEGKRNAPFHAIRAISHWLEKANTAGLIQTDAPESVDAAKPIASERTSAVASKPSSQMVSPINFRESALAFSSKLLISLKSIFLKIHANACAR